MLLNCYVKEKDCNEKQCFQLTASEGMDQQNLGIQQNIPSWHLPLHNRGTDGAGDHSRFSKQPWGTETPAGAPSPGVLLPWEYFPILPGLSGSH